MHEASLVEGLLQLITTSVEKYNAQHPEQAVSRVREVVCEYGLLACFEETTLRACFELFAEGTVAQGAALKLNVAPLKCHCQDCGSEFELTRREFFCPSCKSPQITFSGGNGLVLQAINVDAGEETND